MEEKGKEAIEERKAYMENQIMSILIELYEDQMGAKYTWKKADPQKTA
ncbi:MAG: hypothetical protein UFJ18_07110 [Blautia sp.]|nr:hypothetical protein [Blautia sp.]